MEDDRGEGAQGGDSATTGRGGRDAERRDRLELRLGLPTDLQVLLTAGGGSQAVTREVRKL